MGIRGTKPFPLELHKLNGNPAKKNLGKMERETPRARVSVPEPPKHLDKVAKHEWKKIGKLLLELGIVAQLDEDVLETYCLERSLKDEALRVIMARHSIPDIEDEDERSEAEAKLKKALLQYRRCEKVLIRLYGELGLTASARSRIRTIDPGSIPAKESKFAKFA